MLKPEDKILASLYIEPTLIPAIPAMLCTSHSYWCPEWVIGRQPYQSTERSLKVFSVAVSAGTQAGAYGVSTVSKVSVKTGNYITIPCRYDQRYIQYVKYWCQGDYWNSCSALVRTDQPKISGTVSISDDVTRRIFSVNMTDLQPEDSGYYWCAVETAGRDQNAYLHLSVTTG